MTSRLPLRSLVAPLALGAAVLASAPASAKPADDPLSIRNVLQAEDKVDGVRFEEIAPGGISAVRWYVAGDRSLLLWNSGDQVFVYTVVGEGHIEAATALGRAIARDGIARAVVSRAPVRSQGFLKYHEVIAIQLDVVDRRAKGGRR